MSMALACHGGPSITPLTTNHLTAVQTMWESAATPNLTPTPTPTSSHPEPYPYRYPYPYPCPYPYPYPYP